MINELYSLSTAMKRAGIQAQSWDRKYKLIPNIRPNAPCIRIEVCEGKVSQISSVEPELGMVLRKYGSNQGAYPCMNLAPLYRISDDDIKKEYEKLKKIPPEKYNEQTIDKIKSWCIHNNWGKKFQEKYKISMVKTPEELVNKGIQYQPLQLLISETRAFNNSEDLHEELSRLTFLMLERKEQVSLALQLLFYPGKSEKKPEDDYGTLSVAFEAQELLNRNIPAVSAAFVDGLNNALLECDSLESTNDLDHVDAFGVPFDSVSEPMPEVKLAGSLDVKLRSMFKEQKCQTRYGRIEDGSYPISREMRKDLQASLSWISDVSKKDINWINSDINEYMFVYPYWLPQTMISYTNMFHHASNLPEKTFQERSKRFLEEFKKARAGNDDPRSEGIQIFIIRKIDKARTKVIYTRQTEAMELESLSREWTIGCHDNLPKFPFGELYVPAPLSVSDILNTKWKMNGEKMDTEFKQFQRYHGMELFMESELSVTSDLHSLVTEAVAIGGHLGNLRTKNDFKQSIWGDTKNILALTGLLLYRENIRKDEYMENLPFLYGQLLKTSDELHALYCKVVRNGDYPMQFVGSELYQSATEAPIRTLNVLGRRIAPYYSWAKSYRLKNVNEDGKESWRARWLYSQYERISGMLNENWSQQTRFNDEEKAQFFIGYLAAFPKNNSVNNIETKEDIDNE